MRAKRWGAYGLVILALPVVGKAQIPLIETPADKGQTTSAPVGGKASFDLIRLKDGSLSVPLRYGNVIERSETVVLAGRTLSRERDYSIDYPSGLVYLKVSYREGQSVNVSYRYDDTKQKEGIFGSVATNGSNAFTFDISPGTRALMGMGYTERLSDGTVLNGNIFGLATSMKFGGGSLNGLMLVNDRHKSDTSSLYGDDGPQQELEEGTGKAIVQNYSTNALGGKLQLSYQDIDDKFAGFSSFAGAGFTDAQIKAFQGEKGLKRTGFGLTDAKWGQMSFGGGVQSVGDGTGAVTWRSAAASLAGVSLNWNSLVVDPSFNKFDGLREEDRAQLRKERGLERQDFGLGYKAGGTDSKFDYLSVRGSEDEQGLWKSNFALKNSWLTASWMRQSVDEGFTRFGDLREGDRGQLAKERGIDRDNYSFGIASSWLKANYKSDSMMTNSGDMKGSSFDLGFGDWSFSRISRKMDEAFGSQGSLTNEDKNAFIGDVARMYDPAAKPNGRDMGGLNTSGVDREGMRLAGGVGDYKTFWNQVTVDNKSGTIRMNEFAISKGKTSLKFSEQTASDGFTGIRSLLDTEQKQFGTLDGLQKTDLDFKTAFGKNGKFDFNTMRADQSTGSAFRQRLDLSVGGLGVSFWKRGVDAGFRDVGQLVDSERGLLQGLIGYDQSELIANYKPSDAMSFGYRETKAINSIFDEMRGFRQFAASLRVAPKTLLGFESVAEAVLRDGTSLIDTQYTSTSVQQDLGKAGKLTVQEENHKFTGSDQNLPDAQKRTFSYEKQLNQSTNFTTTQSETKYDDGTRETESRNKISTKLNGRLGVSVEDQRILRDGDLADEVRRNYGFWFDFGSGVKLNYGYNRDARGESTGTMNTDVGLSGGKFAGLDFGGASYKTNRWDGQHQNYFGNVSLANAVPFKVGGVSDISFYYKTDTQRDFLEWKKEFINMGFSAAVGNLGFGWKYDSQVSGDGIRAIDRSFLLTSDKTGKSPFQAALKYGIRTMPNDSTMFVRDYAIGYRANKFLALEHKMTTNPLQNRGGVLLGTVPLDERTSSWTANYQNDPKLKFDFNWNEIKRDNVQDEMRREARFNATLFADQASPVQLTYSLQQFIRNGETSLAHSYGISFTQRPGPNQSLSFSLEHLQWGQGRPDNNPYLRDWKLRFDYGVKF
ncbi:MAG: hypothetical protein ACKVQS_07820 [Fimbriimonadaceae bacterium]